MRLPSTPFPVKKILMVCLGNICRSPLAEGILRSKALQHGLDVEVDSAGTISWHAGHPPDERSVAAGKKSGIDIGALRGRKITTADFDRFDLILVMDAQNYSDVAALARDAGDLAKVHLLLEFAGHGRNDVPDPYYGTMQDFHDLYRLLDEACNLLITRLREHKL